MIYLIFMMAYFERFFGQLSFFDGRRGWRAIIMWPEAEGVFPHDEVRFVSHRDRDKKQVIVLSEPYTYSVQGKTFRSRQILPERLYSSRPRLRHMNKMLVGKRGFRVYVNPHNPKEAYLSPGYARKDWLEILLFPLATFIVPLGAIFIERISSPDADLLTFFSNLLYLNPLLHIYFAILYLVVAIAINWTPIYGKRIFPILGTRDLEEEYFRSASEYYGPGLQLDAKAKVRQKNIHYEYLPADQ